MDKDLYKEYSQYFKEYEYQKENIDFFQKEVNGVMNYIFDEIEYTRKFIRVNQKGIEVNYLEDLEKFEKNVEKYKEVFGVTGNLSTRKPQRISKIFATQYNYLTHLNIKEKTINDVFEVIREELFKVKKNTSLKKAKNELQDNFYKSYKAMQKSSLEWKQLVENNPKLTLEELIKKSLH